MEILTIIFITSLIVYNNADEDCRINTRCIPISECRLKYDPSLIYPCGDNMVCCPNSNFSNLNAFGETTLENKIHDINDENCGLYDSDDRIIQGKDARIGQFPWMALLGYRQSRSRSTLFLCGGTIIGERYILTAAHCINVPFFELTTVRLGELDLRETIDCDKKIKERICADPYVELPIERTIVHDEFDPERLSNDIALLKLRNKIQYTLFIKPICLPFPLYMRNQDLKNQSFIVSGWGKTDPTNIMGSNTLQFAPVKVWDQSSCNNAVPPKVKPLRQNQLCANGEDKQDACKGDSGGPLMNITVLKNGDIRLYQIGIVSHASADTCGNNQIPTIYTRIDKYLDWILKYVKD